MFSLDACENYLIYIIEEGNQLFKNIIKGVFFIKKEQYV